MLYATLQPASSLLDSALVKMFAEVTYTLRFKPY
jgi:hypothetical protein